MATCTRSDVAHDNCRTDARVVQNRVELVMLSVHVPANNDRRQRYTAYAAIRRRQVTWV